MKRRKGSRGGSSRKAARLAGRALPDRGAANPGDWRAITKGSSSVILSSTYYAKLSQSRGRNVVSKAPIATSAISVTLELRQL